MYQPYYIGDDTFMDGEGVQMKYTGKIYDYEQ